MPNFLGRGRVDGLLADIHSEGPNQLCLRQFGMLGELARPARQSERFVEGRGDGFGRIQDKAKNSRAVPDKSCVFSAGEKSGIESINPPGCASPNGKG